MDRLQSRNELTVGSIVVDLDAREVTANGRTVPLTRTEFLRCHVLHCLRRDGGWATDEGLAYGRAQLDLALQTGVPAEIVFSRALLGGDPARPHGH